MTIAQVYDLLSYGPENSNSFLKTALYLSGLPWVDYLQCNCLTTSYGDFTEGYYLGIQKINSFGGSRDIGLEWNEKESLIDKWLMK